MRVEEVDSVSLLLIKTWKQLCFCMSGKCQKEGYTQLQFIYKKGKCIQLMLWGEEQNNPIGTSRWKRASSPWEERCGRGRRSRVHSRSPTGSSLTRAQAPARAPHWLAVGIPGQEAASRLPGSGTAAGGQEREMIYRTQSIWVFIPKAIRQMPKT